MKITNLYIKNFKSIKEVSFELKNLNVFAGMNGMGKSSVIQTLLLLKQSEDRIARGIVTLNKQAFVELGQARDVLYQFAEEKKINFKIQTDIYKLDWNFDYSSDDDYLDENIRGGVLKFNYQEIQKSFNLFSNNFQYLNAERLSPKITYKTSSYYVNSIKQLGNQGEFTAHYLNVHGNEKVKNKAFIHMKAKSNILLHQVDAWLSEISPGTKLNTTNIPGTDLVLLDFQFETIRDYTNRFRPVNVGFGLSYVLPVIVALLTAEKDKLIIIENPEAHLHPRGQAEMGKLIALAAEAGAQLIIETHSDHLLNGIRVAVKEKIMSEQNVALFYFNRMNTEGGEQYSQVTSIKIDRNGEFSEYPKDFMDEWSNQLYKLI